MSMPYIRRMYQVPAKRGMRVSHEGRLGIITGSRGHYLRVRFDNEKFTRLCHPTSEMVYCPFKEHADDHQESND